MKNLLKSTLFIILLIMIQGSVYAQTANKTKNELLTGTWGFDYNRSINSIQSKSKEFFDGLNDEKKNQIKKMYSQRKISFLPDGQLILELAPGQQKKGSWKLNEDQKSLYIKMDTGRELNQTIEEITSNSLKLNLGGNQPEDNRLFHEWYLNKIN